VKQNMTLSLRNKPVGQIRVVVADMFERHVWGRDDATMDEATALSWLAGEIGVDDPADFSVLLKDELMAAINATFGYTPGDES